MPTFSEVKRRFGVSRATVTFLQRLGYLRNFTRLSQLEFREIHLLRTVAALQARNVPARTVHRAIDQLALRLPGKRPLSTVRLQVIDDSIVVREVASVWEPESGQYALPLEMDATESQIITMKKIVPAEASIDTAHKHFLRGADLEEDDTSAAMAAYAACLAGDCSHLHARINLGRLLHLEGKHQEAESLYRGTTEPDALLYFNLGVLLDDQNRHADAMEAYRQTLVHDPGLADAHFNLALLLERDGGDPSRVSPFACLSPNYQNPFLWGGLTAPAAEANPRPTKPTACLISTIACPPRGLRNCRSPVEKLIALHKNNCPSRSDSAAPDGVTMGRCPHCTLALTHFLSLFSCLPWH